MDLGEKERWDMGGWGSGWQGPKKYVVEDCFVLSIKELARAGLLKTGCPSVSWCWRAGDKTMATVKLDILIYPDKGTIWLTNTAGAKPMHDTISLLTTEPHYGGRRWWFVCPIKKIRVAKLYLPPGATRFASRQAHDLTYRSSQESGWRERSEKFWRRLAERLGGDDERTA